MTILIVAISGRALAVAARRAKEKVIVADLFADSDTAALAPCLKIRGSIAGGFDHASLLNAVGRCRGHIKGVVYGSGFEGRTRLLRRLTEIAPLLGNPPDVVETVKDPFRMSRLLSKLGLPHPETSSVPGDHGWLRKLRGGAGGGHIIPAEQGTRARNVYYQKKTVGRPVSALFVANGRRAKILGFSVQWTAPSLTAPYRFGGCAGPIAVSASFSDRLAEACTGIVRETRLVGLNSLDLLVTHNSFTVLEINPRPGATLNIFDRVDGPSLWRIHRAAIAGWLPSQPLAFPNARAAAIAYARADVFVPTDIIWPHWVVDRPTAGAVIKVGDPICTVLASAGSANLAAGTARHQAARMPDFLPSLHLRNRAS